MATNNVSYDGFNFADYDIVCTVINHLTIAPRTNQIITRANRNGGKLVQSNLGVKPIEISGYYIGSSPEDAQSMYDTLASILNRQERPLVVPHAGGTRQYTATPENIIIENPDGLNRLTFSFEFVVPDGHSIEQTTTTLVDETVTTASSTIPLTIDGSVTARPFITLTFDSVTGGTAKTVTLRNAKDFVGLTFSRDFVTGDVITVDAENFQIYVNDTAIEPDGRIPTWAPGTGALYYSDTFTNRSVDVLATYIEKNL